LVTITQQTTSSLIKDTASKNRKQKYTTQTLNSEQDHSEHMKRVRPENWKLPIQCDETCEHVLKPFITHADRL